MPQKALAERLGSAKANEMSVSSCLKILEKNSYIERGSEGEHQARVTLRIEPDEFLRQVEGKSQHQKEIVNYFFVDSVSFLSLYMKKVQPPFFEFYQRTQSIKLPGTEEMLSVRG